MERRRINFYLLYYLVKQQRIKLSLYFFLFHPSAGKSQGVVGFFYQLGPSLHHPMWMVYKVHNYTPLTIGCLPSQHLDPTMPKFFWFTVIFPTCLIVAEPFLDAKRTSPEGNFNVVNFPLFAISFAIKFATLANCPPFSWFECYVWLCLRVILVEVDSSFWSIKTIFEIVQASYKANKFLDVDYDIYTYGSYKSIYIDKYRSHNEVPPNGYIGI